MIYNTEEEKQNDAENNQIEETERKKITCPECHEEFQDMRGLTSHARHIHQLNKQELIEVIKNNTKSISIFNMLSGIGLSLLTVLILGYRN